jgi:hypothetical protein
MDTNTRLRDADDAHFTATEVLTAVHLGPMVNPLTLCIMIPAFAQAADTFAPKIEFRNSSATVIATQDVPHVHAAGLHKIPFFCDLPTLHDMLVTLTYTDADTTSVGDLGHVEVWIEPV